MLPVVSKPTIKCPSSKVRIFTVLVDPCCDVTLFKLVMTDRIYWFIGWQFDQFRIDKEAVKSVGIVVSSWRADYRSVRHDFVRVRAVVDIRPCKKPRTQRVVCPDAIVIHRERSKYP